MSEPTEMGTLRRGKGRCQGKHSFVSHKNIVFVASMISRKSCFVMVTSMCMVFLLTSMVFWIMISHVHVWLNEVVVSMELTISWYEGLSEFSTLKFKTGRLFFVVLSMNYVSN
jgi:hypothetical protein